MKKWLRNRKAVSPVIAALLLIAISVAAAVITYSWVMTMIEGQGSQAQTNIRLEEVTFDNATNDEQLMLIVRNAGGVTAQIQTIYVYDGDTRILKYDTIAYAIAAGETAEIGVTNNTSAWVTTNIALPEDSVHTNVGFIGDFVVSHAYNIKIITDNGFTIEGTYYSPGSW